MRHSSTVGILLLAFTSGVAGCASSKSSVTLQRSAAPAQSLDQVTLSPGTRCLLHLANGEALRGRVDGISTDAISLDVDGEGGPGAQRTITQSEIVLLGKLVTMSKGKRGWIGAAVVAAASLPVGISLVGDMVVPAAIAGALIGYHTGQERAVIVYERRPGGR